MANVVGYAETQAIQAFLGYLNKNYSKLVDPKDTYLIAAVSAWFHQESGGVNSVIGNNPFNIRPGMVSFMSNGFRVSTRGNGKFLTFATMAKGFEATAYLLLHANKAYGYQLAISALKHGGNQAAVDFLAALSRSSWDGANYGTHDWLDAYNPAKNHLLRAYTSITGIQLADPNPKHAAAARKKAQAKAKARIPPPLPRDFNYNVVVRNYLDPWAAKDRYQKRHGVASKVDGTLKHR